MGARASEPEPGRADPEPEDVWEPEHGDEQHDGLAGATRGGEDGKHTTMTRPAAHDGGEDWPAQHEDEPGDEHEFQKMITTTVRMNRLAGRGRGRCQDARRTPSGEEATRSHCLRAGGEPVASDDWRWCEGWAAAQGLGSGRVRRIVAGREAPRPRAVAWAGAPPVRRAVGQ